VLIHALPIYHTHGLFVASNVTLFARASMIFLPKLDPELIVKLMARATVLMGVPTFLHAAASDFWPVEGNDKTHAAVRVGLRAAARRHPSRMVCAHRSCRARSATA
jgi:acyl-CoA synthetase (AMP-forming)/AMP-acid ligase II